MTFKQDDTLFTQSTFLEGCEITQSERSEAQNGIFSSASKESDLLEISTKQVSWFVASTLIGSFFLFTCGYQVGKLHKTYPTPLASDVLVPDSLGKHNNKASLTVGSYASYEDALTRYTHLKQQGKNVSLSKKMSCSVAGVERFWYLVSEGEVTT